VGCFFFEQAGLLADRGFSVYLLFETNEAKYLNRITRCSDGLFIVGIKKREYSRSFVTLQFLQVKYYQKKFLNNFRKIFKGIRFSGSIAQNIGNAGFWSFWLNVEFNIPYALIQRNPLKLNDNYYFSTKRRVTRVVRGSCACYCVSNDLIRQFRLHGITQPIQVLNNPLGIDKFRNSWIFVEKPKHRKSMVLGLSGQYSHVKNQKLFFDALRIVVEKVQIDFKIKWFGYNSWDGGVELEILESELGLKNFRKGVEMELYPIVKREEMPEMLGECDIFSSTSFNETFGNAQIEALSLGIPVITTQNGGCNEFMDSYCGLIVNSFDPNIYADNLIQLIENLNHYDSQLIMKNIRNKFSIEIYLDKLFKLDFL
jgi:glycosyltransferase involved in cell wall biosynthesis